MRNAVRPSETRSELLGFGPEHIPELPPNPSGQRRGPKKLQMRSDVYHLLCAAIRQRKQSEEIRAALSLILLYRVSSRTAARWKAEVEKSLEPSSNAALKAHYPRLVALLIPASSEAPPPVKVLRRRASKIVGKKIPLRTFYRWRKQILEAERGK